MSVATYRKRPVTVEALQWTGENLEEMQEWTGAGATSFYLIEEEDKPYLDNPENTADLWVAANGYYIGICDGEWVLKDELGFYPCKDEMFKKVYERVENV